MQSVTVLMSNTRLYGPASALEGIEEATRAAGFSLGVRVVESGTPEAVRDAVARAVEPSGSLIIIAYDQPGIAALRVARPTCRWRPSSRRRRMAKLRVGHGYGSMTGGRRRRRHDTC